MGVLWLEGPVTQSHWWNLWSTALTHERQAFIHQGHVWPGRAAGRGRRVLSWERPVVMRTPHCATAVRRLLRGGWPCAAALTTEQREWSASSPVLLNRCSTWANPAHCSSSPQKHIWSMSQQNIFLMSTQADTTGRHIHPSYSLSLTHRHTHLT